MFPNGWLCHEYILRARALDKRSPKSEFVEVVVQDKPLGESQDYSFYTSSQHHNTNGNEGGEAVS
jgi:hypothetical protein